MQHRVIWLVLLLLFKNMLIADKNIANDNKHIHCCSGVNSGKADETAAHHGGEEGRVLVVPVYCLIWALYKQNSSKNNMLSVLHWDGKHFELYDVYNLERSIEITCFQDDVINKGSVTEL